MEFVLSGRKAVRSLPLYEYNYFWSIYAKVRDERTIFAIRRKIDRLSEDFSRRFEGEFYTPIPFAAKAYEYLEKTIGKRKLESGAYRIWDMAAGERQSRIYSARRGAALYVRFHARRGGRRLLPTHLSDGARLSLRLPQRRCGALERGLRRREGIKENVQLSMLGGEEREAEGEWKLPEALRRDLADPRIRWLIFINPPFATGNSSSLETGKTSKNGVADTKMRALMTERGYGESSRELFSQFLFRISAEFGGKRGYLGLFSHAQIHQCAQRQAAAGGVFPLRARARFPFLLRKF